MRILLLLCLGSLPIFLMGQASLRIENGATLKMLGNPNLVVNNAHFQNEGQFDPAAGTVILSGNQLGQTVTIGGNSYTEFYRLEINRPNANANLAGTVDIISGIKVTKGFLDLNGQTMVLKGQISGESEDARIIGPNGGEIVLNAQLNMPNEANPGNMGLEITSPSNLGDTWIIRGHQPMDAGGLPGIERWFEIVPEFNNNLDATIRTYYFDGERNGITEADLVQWHGNVNQLVQYPNALVDPVGNWIETDQIPEFGFITLGNTNTAPLPIELIRFEAAVTPNLQVRLDWTTSTEIDNDFFTLERSENGIDFEPFAIVDGAGNSREVIHYQHLDETPFWGQSYYQLRQTDFDGTETLSEVRTVLIEVPSQVSVFPNPFSDRVQIQLTGNESENTLLRLFDATGRLVRQEQLTIDRSMIEWTGLSSLAAGNYLLEVQSSKQNTHVKLIKTE
ncbi:MAG: T9SS type A sorting domain-containing protein [Bacteroidota bacterium]